MATAYAPYLSLLTWTFIVPKHALEHASDPNTAAFNAAPIGTGPFKWDKRIAGQSVTVVANPTYFGEGPFVERVSYNYLPDTNVAYTQFKTGQIDYIGHYGIPAQYVKEARTLPDRKVFVSPSAAIDGIIVNLGRAIFQDKAVRTAMYFGLNKTAIIDLVHYGLLTESESFTSPTSWAYNPNLPKHVYDLAAGNKVLDEAGWTKGSDGVRSKGGNRLEFTFAAVAGNAQREQILQLVQQDWRKLGIATQIKTMPAAVAFGEYYMQSRFDCMFIGSRYGTGNDPDPAARFASTSIPVQGGSGLNVYQYKNPEVDRLLKIGQTSFKLDERKEVYHRIQAIIREDLIILPICRGAPVEGTKAKLAGFRSNPNLSVNSWNIGSWSWTS